MAQISGIRIEEAGAPEVMKWSTWEEAAPGPDEIRIRHAAMGVNFIDTYQRSGLYQIPLPSGLGLEGAGVVDAVGSEVTGFREGDRVGYCSGPPGAYATKHIIKAARAVRLPDGVPDDIAAASMLKGFTVQYLIRQIHHCGPDDTILFHAGAGGVGQIAVQWLKHLGTTVIATAGGAEKCRIVADLGADHVIDYRSEDVPTRVREITQGTGVPVVYDGVGAATWNASLDSLMRRGLMVSFGNASGPVKGVDIGILSAKGSLFVTRPTLAHYTSTREALQAAADDYFSTLQSGAVKVSKPTEYDLKDAAQAHKDLESRKTTGSLILRP